jgi:hypothetical protein
MLLFSLTAPANSDNFRSLYNESLALAGRSPEFVIMTLDEVLPTQDEIGFYRVDMKAQELKYWPGLNPHIMATYLQSKVMPVVEHRGLRFAIDRHHLTMALRRLGAYSFLTKPQPLPHNLNPDRRAIIEGQRARVGWHQMRNNPYRSLVSLVIDTGHIHKTGKPHQEFDWAHYFQYHFRRRGLVLTDEDLKDPNRQRNVVDQAIALARSPLARQLDGFVMSCNSLLGGDLFGGM